MHNIIQKSLLKPITLNFTTIHIILCFLFFFSGTSALIYQIMWQRMLFTLFGVDITSITIIVSVFMFGLGIGGILGGMLADRLPNRLLMLYVVIELMIAVFGVLSPTIIHSLGTLFFSASELKTFFSAYVILAIPTLLMGMTFPLLVTHVNKYTHHIGQSVGSLYFANTLGGALGAYVSGFILLFIMPISSAIYIAAGLNLIIGIFALLLFKR